MQGQRMIGSWTRFPTAVLAVALPVFLSASTGHAAATWTYTGSMAGPRWGHTATLLQNGKVLVAGGRIGDGPSLVTAELYDPVTGTWSATGSLLAGGSYQNAILLQDGRVLQPGIATCGPEAGAQLYDPATGTWSFTGPMQAPRQAYAMARLANGKVLVAGGFRCGDVATAELYDPATNTWSPAGTLAQARALLYAVLLPDGRVLVAGGASSIEPSYATFGTSELYDPVTNTWTMTGSLNAARNTWGGTYGGGMVVLPNGKVLIAGGVFQGGVTYALDSAELYDPETGTWTPTGSLNTTRIQQALTLLPDGRALIAGGGDPAEGASVATAELYHPAAGTWTYTTSMNTPRNHHSTTLLQDGRVLVAGSYPNATATAELYQPATNGGPTANAGPDQEVDSGAIVTLDGSASSDPENDPLTYTWEQTAGPPVSLDLTDPVHPTFVAPAVPCPGATLRFQLAVSDGSSLSGPDVVEVEVTSVADADGDGVTAACDCDDTNGTVRPGAPQLCDGLNNDCSDPQWPAVPADELDPDGDQIPACADNCPLTPNPGQENGGGSSCGNACDPAPLTVRITPRTLNERSEGLFVKAHLRLGAFHSTASFDPGQPILLSVAGGPPIADLARQVTGDDLVVSFSRQDIVAAAPVGDAVEFRLTGGVTYGCAFEGVDQVRVIGEGNVHTNEDDWSSIVDDAPRGDLDHVRANGNGSLGDVTCLPDYQSNYDFSTNADPDAPPPGKVWVYLFKFCNGTANCSYGQTSSGQERTVGSGGCP